MVQLHGIPNCDKVKTARCWLDAHAVAYQFHDFRAEGVHAGNLAQWCTILGWEHVLNRRSTTWKQLPESERDIDDAAHAIALMLRFPTLIKRPVLVIDGRPMVGFDDDRYAEALGLQTA